MKKIKDEPTKISLRIEEIKDAFNEWRRSETVARRTQETKNEKEKEKVELLKSLREQLESLA